MYATEALGDRVTEYSEAVSVKIPQPIKDYHARIYKERSDSYYMISTFESQALLFLSRAIGAKRGKSYHFPHAPNRTRKFDHS